MTNLHDAHGAAGQFPRKLQPHRTRTVQEMVIPGCPRRPERRVPWLSISGRWLEQAGFTPGMQASIRVHRGRIVIRPGPTDVAAGPLQAMRPLRGGMKNHGNMQSMPTGDDRPGNDDVSGK